MTSGYSPWVNLNAHHWVLLNARRHVTSNLDFSEWDQAFPANRLLAAATLDRLRHNAYCLTLDGASYRSPKMVPATPKSRLAKQVKSTEI